MRHKEEAGEGRLLIWSKAALETFLSLPYHGEDSLVVPSLPSQSTGSSLSFHFYTGASFTTHTAKDPKTNHTQMWKTFTLTLNVLEKPMKAKRTSPIPPLGLSA